MSSQSSPDPVAGRGASPRLGENTACVLRAIVSARAPVTAYGLLERLRPEGFRAPPTVYRALRRLLARGLVHRLETGNAYVACRHPGHEERASFLICEDCGAVSERLDERLGRMVEAVAGRRGFRVTGWTVELLGRCKECRGNDSFD